MSDDQPRPGLHKTYPGGVHAVRAVDLAIKAGEAVALLGPNGARQVDDDRPPARPPAA